MKSKNCYSCNNPINDHSPKEALTCIENIIKKNQEDYPRNEPPSNTCSFCKKPLAKHTQEDAKSCIEIFINTNSRTVKIHE